MTSKRTTLLIEHLDFLTSPLWGWEALRRGGGFYITATKVFSVTPFPWLLSSIFGLKHLRYADFDGSYFEVHRIATTVFNDRLCDEAFEGESRNVLAFLLKHWNHPLMNVAMRKVIIEQYSENRVKAVVALKNLITSGADVIFMPRDNRDLAPLVPNELRDVLTRAKIPHVMVPLNRIRSIFDSLSVVAYTTLAAVFLLFQRGVTARTPQARHWDVGLDTFNVGFSWDKPFHSSFIYGDGPLAPQQILHVVRNRLEDKKTRELFKSRALPYIEASKLPIPLMYFFRRILGAYWCSVLAMVFSQLFKKDVSPFLWAASVIIFPNMIRAEILEMYAKPRVFLARDEYGVVHILRTLLYDQRGGKTVGFSHGDDGVPMLCNSHYGFHYFCFSGEFYFNTIPHAIRYTDNKRLIGAGIFGLDKTHELMMSEKVSKKGRRLIGVFPTDYTEDIFVTRAHILEFYKAVLSLLDDFPEIDLLIRPKSNNLEEMDPQFTELLARAKSRVVVDVTTWSYEILPKLDLLIGVGISTIGMEALTAGIPVIYFNNGMLNTHPYERFDKNLVASSAQDLKERVCEFLNTGQLVKPSVMEDLRNQLGYRFDGKVAERLRGVVLEALNAATSEKKTDGTSESSDLP